MLSYLSKYYIRIPFFVMKQSNILLSVRMHKDLGTKTNCLDVADTTDCAVKAAQGLCTANSTAGATVKIYCQKTCNLCPATYSNAGLSCNSLKIGCKNGTCASATYFNQPSISCTCPAASAGDYCERGMCHLGH